MLHLELVLHFSIDVYVPELDGSLGRPATELVLRIAQGAPFLMHGVLAISARHLFIIRPDDSARYLDQAFRLQTRAIELFHLKHHEPGREKCHLANGTLILSLRCGYLNGKVVRRASQISLRHDQKPSLHF